MECSYYKNFGKTDEREKMLLSWYPEENPTTVAINLDLWRKLEQKSIDEFPKSKSSFTYFINHKIERDNTPSKYDVSGAQYKAWEKAMYELWTPRVMKSRMHMLAEMFSSRIDKFQEDNKSNHKMLSRAKCLDAMGGTRTVLKSIVDDLAAMSLDDIVKSRAHLFNGAESFEALDDKLKTKAKYIQNQYKKLQDFFPGIDLLCRSTINKYETSVNVKTFANEDDYTEDEKGAITELKGKRYSDHSEADIESSLTERAKLILRDLYETTKYNTPQYDDLGYLVRVDPDAAFKIIVNTCWASTSETFISDLRSQANTYRWMNDLADRLESNFNDAAAIWASAKKAKNTYIYMKLNNKSGHYSRSIINTRAADNALLKEMNVNFGHIVLDTKHPAYNENGEIIATLETCKQLEKEVLKGSGSTRAAYIHTGINDAYFEPEKSELGGYNIPRTRKTVVDGNTIRVVPGNRAMEWYLNTYPDEVETVADVARGLGINIAADDIRRAALTPIKEGDRKYFHLKPSKKANNRYDLIASTLVHLTGAFTKRVKYEEMLIHVADALDDLFKALNPGVYDQVASKGMDEDKIRQTYTTPNLLSEVMLTLRNERDVDDNKYRETLEQEFLAFEGHTLKGAATGFLDYILNGTNSYVGGQTISDRAKEFTVLNLSSFNHSLYEDMKKQQVASAQFSLFRGNNHHESPAFILPVVSDYTTCYVYQVPEDAIPTIEDTRKSGTSKHLLVDSTRKNKFGETGIYNYNAPIVQALADEVLIEYHRILSIEDRKANGNPDRVVLKAYERNGLKFQIFPEMETMGFRTRFEAILNDQGESEALDYLKYTVAKLLSQNVRKDWEKFEATGAFKSPEFRFDLKAKEDGSVNPNTGIKNPEFMAEFELFSAQTFYVRQQAVKLFLNDTAQFDNMLEFEKRSMMLHAPGIQVYPQSKEDAVQTVLYLPDLVEDSIYKKEINKLFDILVKKKLMSPEQAEINKTAYDGIKVTDGQGFRTLPSYRRIQRGLGEWSPEQEEAYQLIMHGHFSQEIIDALNIGPKKLRYCGYQAIEAARTNTDTEQKPVKLDVLHKYSEQVLLPFHLMVNGNKITEMSNSPIVGLSLAVYELMGENGLDDDYHDKNGNRNLDVPELILFKSGCKVGYHDGVEGLWNSEDGKPLSIDTIKNRVKDFVANNPNAIQVLDLVGLGKAATIDADTENTKIHIASQAEKMIWGNIDPKDVLNVRGVGKMKSEQARRTYDEISTAMTISLWQKLVDDLGNADRARRILMEEMDKMSYVSEETKMAIARVETFHNKIPLFAPQVQKDAQSILLSVIRKRMTKHKAPGARFAQRTSIGWDVSQVEFQNVTGFDETDKLHIVFNDDGSIKYVEAYIPLMNDALKVFADNKGEISAKRLKELVDENVIPEEMLYAVSYRTPSDAEHSAIPIKIKGFVSPMSGRGIILPREIMVMTGHDYDGDEMPTHFKTIKVEVDEAKVRDRFNQILADKDRMQREFGPNTLKKLAEGETEVVFEKYLKFIKNGDRNRNWWAYKVTVPQYDYTKDAFYYDESGEAVMQDLAAMDNARIDLLFAQMSSLAGSSKMIVPGGFEETKRIIKTIELLRTAKENRSLADKICEYYGISNTGDYGELFLYIRGMKSVKGGKSKAMPSSLIDDWLDKYKQKESPFSAHHEIDSFGYMIETAELIGMFAMNLSSFQMLQKTGAEYMPFKTKNGDSVPTELFGINFDNRKLFQIRDVTDTNMLSRVLSRLINAAVDNGKDPILGFTNICKETVPVIALMCGLGMTEDQINLVINQPSVTMALNKVAVDRANLNDALWQVITDLQGEDTTYVDEDGETVHRSEHGNSGKKIGYAKANEIIKSKTESDFARELVKTPNEVRGELDHSFQVSVLYTLRQMIGAAEDLNSFITSTIRADSSSGSVANTIGNTQNKIMNYEDCRTRILGDKFRIGGLKNMVQEITMEDGMDPIGLLSEILKSPVPQYTSLIYLELYTAMELTKKWMPQARKSWSNLADKIVKMYGYKRPPKGLRDKIYKEMLTWQILKDPAYCAFPGVNSNAEGFSKMQDYMLAEVPAHVQNIKRAIERNKSKRLQKEAALNFLRARERNEKRLGKPYPETIIQKFEEDAKIEYDKDLASLENNMLLKMLKVYKEKGSRMKPRLQLHTGGIDMSKQADAIRISWYNLFSKRYNTDDNHELADLAADLVDYSLFVNGFGFGKYEFSHFASQKVMELAHHGRLLRAINDAGNVNFDNETENDAFITMYCMNHHNDTRLVPKVWAGNLPQEMADVFGVKSNPKKEKTKLQEGKMYLIQAAANQEPVLARYNGTPTKDKDMFTLYDRLGTSNKYGQVTVEYNPYMLEHPEQMRAYQLGDDTSWGNFSTRDFNAEIKAIESYANFDAENERGEEFSPEEMTIENGRIVRARSGFSDEASPAPTASIRDTVQARLEQMKKVSKSIKENKEMLKADAEGGFSAAELAYEYMDNSEEGGAEPQEGTSEPVRYAPMEPAAQSIQKAEAQKPQAGPVNRLKMISELKARINAGDKSASEELKKLLTGKNFSITRLDREKGTTTIEKVPVNAGNLELARQQEAYAKLNELLIPILKKAGVGVGKLSAEEILAMANEGMAMHGVTDFNTTKVFANGLREMIRIAEGYEGQAALPEEFAHVALAMLGDENPLVTRLYAALGTNEAALREAFDGEYDAYRYMYEQEGGDWQNKMIIEAAGKLVAKSLLKQQEVKTTGVRGLIHRIVEAIRNLFRKITSRSVENAIFESENIASKLGRDLLSGRLLDAMKFDNIGRADRFLKAKKDISNSKNIIEKLIAIEMKRENIFDRRLGHNAELRGKTSSYIAVVNQLHQLRMNLKNNKTELAIINYMNNTLDFLRNSEINLDSALNSGANANRISKLLNLLRDTLISNIQAMDIIKQAIDDGEVTDSGSLVSTYNEVSNVISDFHRKYKRLSLTYFEKMLADVYGEDGIDLTVGENKGKHISIHELATIGNDSTLVGGTLSRLFNSMSDQDDLVLQAFDSVVRSAKNRARVRQREIETRIVSAFSALEAATGSRDQTFMFEYKDGKKTGKYISAEASNKLSPAQKKFYDEMMDIKKEADKLIPKGLLKERGIVMIQKSRLDRIGEASGISGKIQAIKDTRREKIDKYLIDDEETAKTVYVDFEGNKVDMLPIKYTSRGNRSFDSMTDDVASSMMAYVGMATEYSEMNGVINILENARYASMERDMIQKRGGRQLQEHSEYADTELTKPFTIKQSRTSAQKCLDDFMSMHVYGHLRAAEGVTPIFHMPKAMIADIISTGTTYTQMAFNFQQRISNVSTGAAQIFVNTAGKDVFSVSDVTWASGQWMKETADRLMEYGKNESTNYLSLFIQKFDIGQKLNDESKKKTYGKSRASRIFNTNLMFAGLELGEDYLSATTGLAVARNVKLMLDGKEINLYDAYEVAYKDEQNKTGAYLKLKSGVTKADGSAFTSEDELDFSKKVAGINFKLQGIYNTDDKAAIQQYSLGALIIMYRKWIAPSLKRRYGGVRYNELTGQEEEGYYRTSFRLVSDVIKTMIHDGESLKASILLNWNNLTDYEKANCQKAITEFGIVVGIIGGLAVIDLLPPDGEDDEKTGTWRDNMVVYQLLRLKNEVGAMAPTPMLVQEATKILSSPMASIRVIDNALKGLNLLDPSNYEMFAGEDAIIKSGRFKGHSKAYKYFWSLPILSIRKSIENAADPEPLIQYYKN